MRKIDFGLYIFFKTASSYLLDLQCQCATI